MQQTERQCSKQMTPENINCSYLHHCYFLKTKQEWRQVWQSHPSKDMAVKKLGYNKLINASINFSQFREKNTPHIFNLFQSVKKVTNFRSLTEVWQKWQMKTLTIIQTSVDISTIWLLGGKPVSVHMNNLPKCPSYLLLGNVLLSSHVHRNCVLLNQLIQ